MKRAVVYILAAAGCVALGGWFLARFMHLSYGHGVYCALGTAATVGCDATPATGTARLVSAAVIVVCIPLFALAYGSLSSAHWRKHLSLHRQATVAEVRAELDAMRAQVTSTVDTAAAGLHRRLNDHADLIRAISKPADDGPAATGVK